MNFRTPTGRIYLSRNKQAVVRVRGGEIWDKVVFSCCCHVSLALEPSLEVGYHIDSGAAGIIPPRLTQEEDGLRVEWMPIE